MPVFSIGKLNSAKIEKLNLAHVNAKRINYPIASSIQTKFSGNNMMHIFFRFCSLEFELDDFYATATNACMQAE